MGEVINLNRERKRRQRTEKEIQAAISRKKYGRNQAEKQQDSSHREQQESVLDGHRIEDTD